jgi:hypothetical protein
METCFLCQLTDTVTRRKINSAARDNFLHLAFTHFVNHLILVLKVIHRRCVYSITKIQSIQSKQNYLLLKQHQLPVSPKI